MGVLKPGFNRTRVELKFSIEMLYIPFYARFNRTRVELKYQFGMFPLERFLVLIAPEWN